MICPSSATEIYRGERCRRRGARSLSGKMVEATYLKRCHSAVSARKMLRRSACSTAEAAASGGSIRSETMPDHDKLIVAMLAVAEVPRQALEAERE